MCHFRSGAHVDVKEKDERSDAHLWRSRRGCARRVDQGKGQRSKILFPARVAPADSTPPVLVPNTRHGNGKTAPRCRKRVLTHGFDTQPPWSCSRREWDRALIAPLGTISEKTPSIDADLL